MAVYFNDLAEAAEGDDKVAVVRVEGKGVGVGIIGRGFIGEVITISAGGVEFGEVGSVPLPYHLAVQYLLYNAGIYFFVRGGVEAGRYVVHFFLKSYECKEVVFRKHDDIVRIEVFILLAGDVVVRHEVYFFYFIECRVEHHEVACHYYAVERCIVESKAVVECVGVVDLIAYLPLPEIE